MRGRLVHDGTLRRVSGVSGGDRDDSPGNAATAESFFHFVASRMRGTVDSAGLLNDYMHVTGAGPVSEDTKAQGLSASEYAALRKTEFTSGGKSSDCPICLTSLRPGDPCKMLPCQHLFCEKCTKRWMDSHTTCPLCRRDCRFVDIIAIAERRRKERGLPELPAIEPGSPRVTTARRPSAEPPAAAPSPRSRHPASQLRPPPARQATVDPLAAPPPRLPAEAAERGSGGVAPSPRQRRQHLRPQAAAAAAAATPRVSCPAPAASPLTRRPHPSPRGAVRLASPRLAATRGATPRAATPRSTAGGREASPRPGPGAPRGRAPAPPSPRSVAGSVPSHRRRMPSP
eukprot:Transcript_18189.p2 GENE.Transcript_18189~~Transcript_18189.p2  ORF type:complete len:343 (-),score=59.09 Transcript_18189:14-1042(-)